MHCITEEFNCVVVTLRVAGVAMTHFSSFPSFTVHIGVGQRRTTIRQQEVEAWPTAPWILLTVLTEEKCWIVQVIQIAMNQQMFVWSPCFLRLELARHQTKFHSQTLRSAVIDSFLGCNCLRSSTFWCSCLRLYHLSPSVATSSFSLWSTRWPFWYFYKEVFGQWHSDVWQLRSFKDWTWWKSQMVGMSLLGW